MANFKNKKNLLQTRGEYARYFSSFRGVDFSSSSNDVADNRFSYLVNMYKDYASGVGGAIETIPGFRALRDFGAPINGIHTGGKNIFLHIGSWLYRVGYITKDGISIMDDEADVIGVIGNQPSVSFHYYGYLYILAGSFYRINCSEDAFPVLETPYDFAYIPTTIINIDQAAQTDTIGEDSGTGREFEQRNLLTDLYKLTYIADGESATFNLKEPISFSFSANSLHTTEPIFPVDFDVYQYGVRLPLAYTVSGGSGEPKIPSGYPNAISYVYSRDEKGMGGKIILCKAPPKPEYNTWNPTSNSYDYSDSEIETAEPVQDDYQWPYAYSAGYAGIEITVGNTVDSVGGTPNRYYMNHPIIGKCRYAALYDNHVFLGGNPDFPHHIFYNVIRINEGGEAVPDASYFGILNYQLEGMSDSAVVGMMSVGDSLLVMKQDSDEEESLLIHRAVTGDSNLQPTLYPSERGHKGIGCLGPCINFRDDPLFMTKFGVDALGHVSTKYRRAIKHRSTLIDAKLLNLNLEKASLTEWGGYLFVLIEGKAFMADSRQMYNTDSGNTEYEWYYLEDIGVYTDEFDEYVFAEFPTGVTSEDLITITGGYELLEARQVRNEHGVMEDLIGKVAFQSEDEISFIENADESIYYKEIPEIDEYGCETGKTIKYYVEPSGAKTGGTFDPAVIIKTIGEDLLFVTEAGVLCKFNFDMRKEDGRIPIEGYDFNGRTIFSGCATKLDNCGIPHLTKTTVKHSTVLKAKSFEKSGFKVKIRTNKKDFTQIDRIVSGRATFDDADFKAYTFSTNDTDIFCINEKEKKWVEKQIFIFSDGYRCPVALHYIAYRYSIAGRYKE